MSEAAARRRALWPALLATVAALLAATVAQASLPRDACRSELLAKPALAAALANADRLEKARFHTLDPTDEAQGTLTGSIGGTHRPTFTVDLAEALQNSPGADKARVQSQPFGLLAWPPRPAEGDCGQALASALEGVGPEKLASGVLTWKPEVNVWRIRYFASILRWAPEKYRYVGWQPHMGRDPLGLKVLRRQRHDPIPVAPVWDQDPATLRGGWGAAPPPAASSGTITIDETVILPNSGTPGEDCQALQQTGMDPLDASARCNAFNPQEGTQPAAYAGARGALMAKKPVDVMATATMIAATFYMPVLLADTWALPAAYLEGSGALGAAHYVPPEPPPPLGGATGRGNQATFSRSAEDLVGERLGLERNPLGSGGDTVPGSGPGGVRFPEYRVNGPEGSLAQRQSVVEVKVSHSGNPRSGLSTRDRAQIRDYVDFVRELRAHDPALPNAKVEFYTNYPKPVRGEFRRYIQEGLLEWNPLP